LKFICVGIIRDNWLAGILWLTAQLGTPLIDTKIKIIS